MGGWEHSGGEREYYTHSPLSKDPNPGLNPAILRWDLSRNQELVAPQTEAPMHPFKTAFNKCLQSNWTFAPLRMIDSGPWRTRRKSPGHSFPSRINTVLMPIPCIWTQSNAGKRNSAPPNFRRKLLSFPYLPLVNLLVAPVLRRTCRSLHLPIRLLQSFCTCGSLCLCGSLHRLTSFS